MVCHIYALKDRCLIRLEMRYRYQLEKLNNFGLFKTRNLFWPDLLVEKRAARWHAMPLFWKKEGNQNLHNALKGEHKNWECALYLWTYKIVVYFMINECVTWLKFISFKMVILLLLQQTQAKKPLYFWNSFQKISK